MKKKILLFGTMLASAIPVATVVSCGDSASTENAPKKPVKEERKVLKADIDFGKDYKSALSNIATAMKGVSGENSIKYLKMGGEKPKKMYFVAKNDTELKKLAKPILEKIGFFRDTRFPKNIISLKEGDLYPKTNLSYNNFKIGYKDETTGKFIIYQDKLNKYDSAAEAVDAFLGLSGNILPTQSKTITLMEFLEIGTGYGNKYPLINSFKKEFDDLGIDYSADLVAVNDSYLVDIENSAYTKISSDSSKLGDLNNVVNKWIPGGVSGTKTNNTQEAIVVDTKNGQISRGSRKYPFSFKVEKDLGSNVSAGLKKSTNNFDNYFIVYGGLNTGKGGTKISQAISSSDFINWADKFAIIDTGLHYHHKQIVFMFIKIKNHWMSWSDLLKNKDSSAKFILEDYWAEDSDGKTVFKEFGTNLSGSPFSGKGLENYNNNKFEDLVKYVKESLK